MIKHNSLLKIIFALLCFCFAWSLQARDYISHSYNAGQLIIQADDGKIIVRVLANNAIETEFQPEGKKHPASFSLLPELTTSPAQLLNNKHQLVLKTSELQAFIQKSPLTISYLDKHQQLIVKEQGFFSGENGSGVKFKISDDEKLLGGGERVLGMDRRGHRLPLYNKPHGDYSTYSEQMNYSLPGVISSKKYLLMFDNAAKGWMDLAKTEANTVSFEAVGGRLAYYIVADTDYKNIINTYTQLTGKQPMPPRWAFGYLASRFGYRNEQEATNLVSKFAEDDFPLDAIIFDLYWFGKDIKGHMGNLQWDREAFPQPEKMMADFQQQGINTVLITEPFILTSSKKWQDAVDNQVLAKDSSGQAQTFDFYFGHTGIVDVFDDKAKQWFWNIYQGLMKQGVAGWWGDLGEPEVHPDDIIHKAGRGDEIHNAFGHEWAKLIYENQKVDFPDKRLFLFMRAGFAGSQRYGLIPWTGDVQRGWGGLKGQVELSLQMGLMGLAYTHSDLGGFVGDNWDAEAYIRWLQYGVFQPIYRPHGLENIAPEPVFHDQQTKDIIRRYVHLRYQLIPYLYTMSFENSQSGMPLMRPLFLQEQNNLELINNNSAYMWGDALLVSPVTTAGVKHQSVYLPAGEWFDFWDDTRYLGGAEHKIPVNLETIPVLVKAGSFIPMVETVTNAANYTSNQLTLHYYHSNSINQASGYMYEDDGETPEAFAKGLYERLNFTAEHTNNNLKINLAAKRPNTAYDGMPAQRQIKLVIHNIAEPNSVLLNQTNLVHKSTYLPYLKQLVVEFEWNHQAIDLIVKN
ncbi:TIM-barrel domain-containing protein [Catenovulum agarivorans]|uniref:glycoside hydrolase family 31 protein n=1 Tax=Catenovulum agarivorans TaxID=1172192 RepID=UPI0002D9D1F1|nr:TIM-barrel domain-containing protein [Catenovulum agarivorans]